MVHSYSTILLADMVALFFLNEKTWKVLQYELVMLLARAGSMQRRQSRVPASSIEDMRAYPVGL